MALVGGGTGAVTDSLFSSSSSGAVPEEQAGIVLAAEVEPAAEASSVYSTTFACVSVFIDLSQRTGEHTRRYWRDQQQRITPYVIRVVICGGPPFKILRRRFGNNAIFSHFFYHSPLHGGGFHIGYAHQHRGEHAAENGDVEMLAPTVHETPSFPC